MELPHLSKYLFGDCDITQMDFDKHAHTVVEKVLIYGQVNDWREIKRYYGLPQIKSLVVDIESLSPFVINFLSIVLNLPAENFLGYNNKV